MPLLSAKWFTTIQFRVILYAPKLILDSLLKKKKKARIGLELFCFRLFSLCVSKTFQIYLLETFSNVYSALNWLPLLVRSLNGTPCIWLSFHWGISSAREDDAHKWYLKLELLQFSLRIVWPHGTTMKSLVKLFRLIVNVKLEFKCICSHLNLLGKSILNEAL